MIAVVKEKHRGLKTLETTWGDSLVTKRVWNRLSGEQCRLLEQSITGPIQFVDNPMFHGRRSARGLVDSFEHDPEVLDQAQARLIPIDLYEDGDRTVGKFKPLSTDQETRLFLKLNYARYMIYKLLGKQGKRPLRVGVARELVKWRQRYLKVRAQLTQANIPLVLAMAKRAKPMRVDFPDLISEGNMALLRSVDKFDCSRGFKFSTYACRAILKSFSRLAIRTNRYRVRFPVEFDPDLEKGDFEETKRENTKAYCVDRLRDILGGNDAELNDIERIVLRTRFAITDEAKEKKAPMTLEQVGRVIGVTKERVRQIQNKALAKLRIALEESVLSG